MQKMTITPTLRQQCFSSPINTIISLIIVGIVLLIMGYLLDWGVLNAVTEPDLQMCRASEGACWGFVAEKYRLILFGRFPYEEHWRAALATFIIVGMLVFSAVPKFWKYPRVLILGWITAFTLFLTLMYGGIFGLTSVETDAWGGLPLTVILTLIGMSASVPIGILLALARRSKLPALSMLASGYIELVRGIPLITVLFVATYIFPLVLPSGMLTDAFWRIAIGIVLFQAAYFAETVRGGLQTVSQGQFLAADSLGLRSWQVYVYVILPQALVAVIPAFVNSLLSTFMDTSLVTVVSMYDLTGALRLALGDPQWRQFFIEGYIFIATIYFFSSLLMSRYSMWLEKHIQQGRSF